MFSLFQCHAVQNIFSQSSLVWFLCSVAGGLRTTLKKRWNILIQIAPWSSPALGCLSRMLLFLMCVSYSSSVMSHMTWFIKKHSWATCDCLTSNAADKLQSHILVQNLVQFFEINPADSQGLVHHPSPILRHKSFWWALGSKEQLIKADVNYYLSALAFLLVLEPHVSHFLDSLTSRKEVKKNNWWKKMCSFL